MRVRDLGPMLVERADGIVPCARGRQAAILATLAMNSNRRVSIDELIVGAWGYDATASKASVENHVWRLRKLLDPTYSTASTSPLRNEFNGYRLVLPVGDLDSTLFGSLAAETRAAWAAQDAQATIGVCDSALALWRGSPYEVIAHLGDTAAVVAGLEEQRGEIAERRVDALLHANRVEEALSDLERLTARYPFRERLWAQRMSGLALRGRTDDALRAYQQLRDKLVDELGVEPGREVTQLHRTILSGGDVPGAGPAVLTTTRATTVRLPRTAAILGRAGEIDVLLPFIEPGAVVTVTGPGGTGKTRLAVEVARLAAGRFPDGVFFVDLTQVTTPAEVVGAVVTTVGLVGGGEPQETLDRYLAGRQVLILLDNCEHVLDGAADLVNHAIDSLSRSTLLSTSREPLNVDGEQLYALTPMSLTGNPDLQHGMSPAAELFLARAWPGSSDPADLAAVESICRAVDGLPLALELAAARTRSFSLGEIVEQVTADPTQLGRIGRGPSDHRRTLASAIEWSYDLLSVTEQVIYRRLSVLPGPFTLPVATAVAQGDDLPVADIPVLLASLVHRSMIVSTSTGVRGRSTVFRQLEVLRAHARHQLDDAGETTAVTTRRDTWVSRLLARRPRLGDPAEAAWYDAVDSSYPTVRATLQQLVSGPVDLDMLRPAAALNFYWYYRMRTVEGRGWLAAVVDRFADTWPGGAEPPEATMTRLGLAGASLLTGDVDAARAQLALAMPQLPGLPSDYLIDVGEVIGAVASAAWANKQFDVVQRMADELDRIVACIPGDEVLSLNLDTIRCIAGMVTRPFSETIDWARRIHDRAAAQNNLLGQWQASGILQIMGELSGDAQLGRRWCEVLIRVHLRLGPGGGPAFLEGLAMFAAMDADFDGAARMFAAAQAEGRRVGMPWPTQMRSEEFLAVTQSSMEAERFEQRWAEGDLVTLLDVARERHLINT